MASLFNSEGERAKRVNGKAIPEPKSQKAMVRSTKLRPGVTAKYEIKGAVQLKDTTTKVSAIKTLYDWAVGKFQSVLVSGTNIKTINSTSLLGSGNIAISAGSSLIIDTKRNILTSTPADPSVALASDTNEYYAYDGTNWNKASLPLSETSANPDIGPMRNNDKLGYNDNSITDNNIANLVLEGSSRTEDGGIRIDHSSSPVKAQIYYKEAWHEFIAFDALPALTHTQKNTQMYATIGNSLLTEASGNPLVQQYAMSIGPLAAKLELDGGTF